MWVYVGVFGMRMEGFQDLVTINHLLKFECV